MRLCPTRLNQPIEPRFNRLVHEVLELVLQFAHSLAQRRVFALEFLDADVSRVALGHDGGEGPRGAPFPIYSEVQLIEPIAEADRCAIHVP